MTSHIPAICAASKVAFFLIVSKFAGTVITTLMLPLSFNSFGTNPNKTFIISALHSSGLIAIPDALKLKIFLVPNNLLNNVAVSSGDVITLSLALFP